MDSIREDMRTIKRLWFPPLSSRPAILVGSRGVTRIEAYEELGQGNYVPWFAVYHGDVIVERVNAAHVASVEYQI